jgi:hypothetical protein
MRWIIGLKNGKVTFEGSPPCGHAVVSAEFDPESFMQARAFASEWMISDSRNSISFRSSWDHPGDEGFDEGFDPAEWMHQLCARV